MSHFWGTVHMRGFVPCVRAQAILLLIPLSRRLRLTRCSVIQAPHPPCGACFCSTFSSRIGVGARQDNFTLVHFRLLTTTSHHPKRWPLRQHLLYRYDEFYMGNAESSRYLHQHLSHYRSFRRTSRSDCHTPNVGYCTNIRDIIIWLSLGGIQKMNG